jgi:hypothetical protein
MIVLKVKKYWKYLPDSATDKCEKQFDLFSPPPPSAAHPLCAAVPLQYTSTTEISCTRSSRSNRDASAAPPLGVGGGERVRVGEEAAQRDGVVARERRPLDEAERTWCLQAGDERAEFGRDRPSSRPSEQASTSAWRASIVVVTICISFSRSVRVMKLLCSGLTVPFDGDKRKNKRRTTLYRSIDRSNNVEQWKCVCGTVHSG